MNSFESKLRTAKWYLVVGCCVGSVLYLVVLFSPSPSYTPPDDGPLVADVSVSTPWIDQVARALREDPILVDPLLVGSVGRSVDTSPVRDAVEDSDTDVFVVAAPSQGVGLNENEVFLARIAEATDRTGVYLLIDQEGDIRTRTHGLGDVTVPLYIADLTEQELASAVADVDDRVAREKSNTTVEKVLGNPVVLGVLVGGMFSVPLWYLMRFIRWSAGRDRSYVKGFRR